jgi:putative hydrolase of the HAD superfamily
VTALRGVKCVVFDIDDTLYLERDYVHCGFETVGLWLEATHGIEGFSGKAWAAFERGVRGNTFDIVVAELGIESAPELIRNLVRVYREHVPDIAILPDARECLDALLGEVVLAAITDGPAISQRNKVRALGLDKWMETIIYTEELGPGFGKPNPRAFEIVEAHKGCHGTECVYVADNPNKDFGGPKALGWRTVRVRRENGQHVSRAASAEMEFEMKDLSALPAQLGVNR